METRIKNLLLMPLLLVGLGLIPAGRVTAQTQVLAGETPRLRDHFGARKPFLR